MKQEYSWYLRRAWPYLIIASACVLLYVITAGYGFSPLDEYWLITKEKETLSSFSNFAKLFSESPTLGMYYRPVLSVSFMTDMVLGNGSTIAFHITNILLHACAMLLLYYFLLQIPLNRTLAFFSTLVFAVHPINVHAVAWIPGRNDLILASFVLLSCIFLMNYLRYGKWYSLVLHFVFFFLCLITKESAILLPLIYFAFWFIFSEKKSIAGILSIAAIWLLTDVGFYMLRSSMVHFMPIVHEAQTGEKLYSLVATFVVYTGKMILPIQQSVMPVLSSTTLWPFFVVVALVIALFARYGVNNKKMALLGLLWFCILIAIPVWMGMANGTGECYEHRGYVPMIGLLLLFSQLKITLSEPVLKGIAVAVVLVFATKAFLRLPVYENEFSYASAGVKEAPGNSQFHDLLGLEYQERDSFELALKQHQLAIAIDSGNADYFSHRGYVYGMLGDYQNALADDDRALKMDHTLFQVFYNRSTAHFGLGEYKEAYSDLDTAKWFGVKIPEGYTDSLNRALEQHPQ